MFVIAPYKTIRWSATKLLGVDHFRLSDVGHYVIRPLLDFNNTHDKIMMTRSNGDIFRVTGPFWGKPPVMLGLPSQRPVTRGFDVFFYLRLSKPLSKQSRHRWFEVPSRWLWRHCNVLKLFNLWRHCCSYWFRRYHCDIITQGPSH